MAAQTLDLKEFTSDQTKFAEACGYMIYPSLSLEQLKACLATDPSLAAAVGRYGSAAYYAADRDGDEEFVSISSLTIVLNYICIKTNLVVRFIHLCFYSGESYRIFIYFFRQFCLRYWVFIRTRIR